MKVAVWTDLEIPGQLDRIVAFLRQETLEADAVRPLDPGGQDQPIVLTLDAGLLERGRPLELMVTGFAGEVAMVERRARLSRLPPGESALAIPLEARCAGLGCEVGWTCIRGACERSELPIEALAASVEDLPEDPLAGVVAGRRVGGCEDASACEDGDPCTIDLCTDHRCSGDGWSGVCITCTTDADCAGLTDEPCLRPFCHPYGVCRWRSAPPGTRCDDDDDPCTVQCCREATVCMTFDVCDEPDVATGCDP
ncbi:MAG: hypothetical protein HY905_26330 [Deltaproteobacteria bacterium]|nr:hypothetical protein [Deltaproteobacteria bacterium]